MSEPFKVYIEVKEGWFDAESPMGWMSRTIRDEAKEAIRDAVVKQAVNLLKGTTIDIPEAELREAVKTALVEKMVDQAISHKHD